MWRIAIKKRMRRNDIVVVHASLLFVFVSLSCPKDVDGIDLRIGNGVSKFLVCEGFKVPFVPLNRDLAC